MEDKWVIINKDGNGMRNGEVDIDHPQLYNESLPDMNMITWFDYLVDQYYNHDHSVIPDEQFDAYAIALKRQNEMEHASKNSLKKYRHTFNVNSLAKCHDIDLEMKNWLSNKDSKFDLEWKADGVTVVIYINSYQDKPCLILTRGGGYEGEDVTHNVMQSPDFKLLIPLINTGRSVILRAEAVVYRNDWKLYSNRYSDQRAMVSGIVRNKDDELAQFIHLKSHGVVNVDPQFGTEILETLHFPTLIIKRDLDNAQVLKEMHKISKEDSQSLNFDTDGLVVKVWNKELRDQLGQTEHHPNWAMAYKFANDQKVGVVDHIEWQIGKTGKYTPVIILKEPVEFGGRSINRISGGSYQLMKRYAVVPGAEITVELANEVIPKITGNIAPDENVEIEIPEDAYIKGAHLFQENFKLPLLDQVVNDIALMGIKGFKGQKVQKLIDHGLLNNESSVMKQLAQLTLEKASPAIGNRNAEKLIEGIEQAKLGLSYNTVIMMMNITGLGWKAAEAITEATKNDSLEQLPNKFKKFLPFIDHDLLTDIEQNYQITY